LAATPSASRRKRSRALPTKGEGKFEDARTLGSGTQPVANAAGPADPPQGPTGQEDDEVTPELDRANVITAFVGSPLLLEPNQLKADNIATFLALAVDGPVQKATFKLLAPTYYQQEA